MLGYSLWGLSPFPPGQFTNTNGARWCLSHRVLDIKWLYKPGFRLKSLTAHTPGMYFHGMDSMYLSFQCVELLINTIGARKRGPSVRPSLIKGAPRRKLNLISSEVWETDHHFKGEGKEIRITEGEAWNVRICEDTKEVIKAAKESEEDGKNGYQDKVGRAVSGNSGVQWCQM